MKLNCGPTQDARRQQARAHYCEWHRWFAWHPVRIAENDCRWLEYVERRAAGVFDGLFVEHVPYDCTYRPIN